MRTMLRRLRPSAGEWGPPTSLPTVLKPFGSVGHPLLPRFSGPVAVFLETKIHDRRTSQLWIRLKKDGEIAPQRTQRAGCSSRIS